ncbi:fumarylacetoacetate hydrolase family protein [Myxosarcina sp. GI1]|uniref:fumarylacetoacetate hydrolase family protein n=1 Tax=Myxosarcina sp. GI1 TaxID=1541065 RepID=UPI000568DD85|nr:fumarylacetoacetate hydrolase family protein [Myxosarcina sp. GI1]
MPLRYVRIKTKREQVYYGLLQANRSMVVLDAPPWLGGQQTDIELEPESYQILAPCAPSKIVAVGKNYLNHAREMGTPVPQEPLLFLKPPTTIIASDRQIVYPPQSERVDYEGELALVIGERCRKLSAEQAAKAIWGYTIANDVTARDLQKKDGQWTRAKGFDTFCPLGPWIVRELSSESKLQTFLNDKLCQTALITEMVFSPAAIVAYISQVMTLNPGDVILTGTPEGIGSMQPGDIVRVEIEGIGSLSNQVTG